MVWKVESLRPWITKPSPFAVSTSVAAPEKISPDAPIVLLFKVCCEVVSTKVTEPEGNVTLVASVTVKVKGKLPLVVKASPKLMTFPFGMVKVPVVSVTVRPFTFSALKAYGTAVNRIRGSISPSPLNSTPRKILSVLKFMLPGSSVTAPSGARKIPSTTGRLWVSVQI
jgi:hypothetical protein